MLEPPKNRIEAITIMQNSFHDEYGRYLTKKYVIRWLVVTAVAIGLSLLLGIREGNLLMPFACMPAILLASYLGAAPLIARKQAEKQYNQEYYLSGRLDQDIIAQASEYAERYNAIMKHRRR